MSVTDDEQFRPSVCLFLTLQNCIITAKRRLHRDGRNYFTAGQLHSFRTTRPNCCYEIWKCGKCMRSPCQEFCCPPATVYRRRHINGPWHIKFRIALMAFDWISGQCPAHTSVTCAHQ